MPRSNKIFVKEIRPHVRMYKDASNGLVWIEDGTTGLGYSCHSNIDITGSIKGMKYHKFWGQKDRCIRSHGFIFNVDSLYGTGSFYDICKKECMCVGCTDRRSRYVKGI